MGCNTETKQIGDHEYSVTQWPATRSMVNKLRLLKVFGASVATVASSITGEDIDDAKALADGFNNLFDKNTPEDIVNLIKSFVTSAARDSTLITDTSFEEYFSGDDLLLAYQVFLFVVKVNYKNLMKGQLADRFLAKVEGL